MYILFGIISGIVAALGMGGSTVLILLLGLFTKINQHSIQGTNLIFFISTAVISIVMNFKNKLINLKLSIYFIISGCIGACVGSLLSFKFEGGVLRKAFGVFLCVLAIFEIYTFFVKYKKK